MPLILNTLFLSAHFRPKSVDEWIEKTNNREEDATKITPH